MDEELQNNIYLVKLSCNSLDKYGRILANVYKTSDTRASCKINNFSDILINEKLGYKYDGGTKLSESEQLITIKFE